ncbi:MAG: DUF1553 domain-containing protein [Planctomycetota bacterium]
MRVVFSAVLIVFLAIALVAEETARSIYESDIPAKGVDTIDAPIKAKLKSVGVEPASNCSDSVFVRRAYIDVLGALPTADEADAFIKDAAPDKRSQLIDALLDRPEYADYWALKWCDALRVKSEFPVNLWPNAVQAYHRWVVESIRTNQPYDMFARSILVSTGSNFRQPEVNFYRAVREKNADQLAAAVALTFMGVRTETWPTEQRANLAAFFKNVKYKKTGEWKEEIVYTDDVNQPLADAIQRVRYVFPDGTAAALPPNDDPRRIFADWLTHPDNPYFAKNAVNRIWFWLFGIGIVNEPDDIRPDNPPSNPELLAALERAFIASGYDVKSLLRLILNSAAYQRSCISATDRPESKTLFAHYSIRRLDAEVLIDAINQITGTTESYLSLIPEPWTYTPTDQRAVALADGSITSQFLELFGRPSREAGFLMERDNTPTDAQALHLLNSSHIRRKIESALKTEFSGIFKRAQNVGNRPRQGRNPIRDAMEKVYLAILSRYPTPDELKTIETYSKTSEAKGPQLLADIVWTMLNSPEFLFRH